MYLESKYLLMLHNILKMQNEQFLVVQDIGTKSNTSIFITFIIMQLAVEQKLTIPNPFIHRSISSYS